MIAHAVKKKWTKGKKSPQLRRLFMYRQLVGLQPGVDLGLSQTDDVLGGVGRFLATANVQEVQATGGLVQVLLIAGRIAIGAERVSLHQSSGLGVVLLLADDLLHDSDLLSGRKLTGLLYIFFRRMQGLFCKMQGLFTEIV